MTSRSYHCSRVFSHHLDHHRLQRRRSTNSSSSSSSSRRLNRSFVRKTTTNASSSEESSSEEQQKSSWKVVSESPFSNSSSTTTNNSTNNKNTLEDSSLASEQPSRLRIEAESSSTRTTEENNVGEEKVGGIPIHSSRRATKMLFTCNKCETRTERKVNKANLTTGTTWVQCGNPSCMVWHKIVDNLGLIYECSEME
ncbi:predicted protein [Bathycoccus prasinos]|uniref:DNL-type domain-containing protein n=1 Tax=Bathycoccus prasinos TaxID=41875 RepID=K8FDA5_9CHLO|nr:predicted protein [Bathycoccus prasinos]CCO20288.1 predicted protein [Bathycoccus prasinos]|eukprot:XP_007508671.1 predicted protein [Bathycoccus prasinos]